MISVNVECNRCGKKCDPSSFYTINIYENELSINHSLMDLTHNTHINMKQVNNRNSVYCKKCTDAIRDVIGHK